jgi:hypothetical protein
MAQLWNKVPTVTPSYLKEAKKSPGAAVALPAALLPCAEDLRFLLLRVHCLFSPLLCSACYLSYTVVRTVVIYTATQNVVL